MVAVSLSFVQLETVIPRAIPLEHNLMPILVGTAHEGRR